MEVDWLPIGVGIAALLSGFALGRFTGRASGAEEPATDDRDIRLDEFRSAYEQRAAELSALKDDVRDAVRKTRELREELIERATESTRERALRMRIEQEADLSQH